MISDIMNELSNAFMLVPNGDSYQLYLPLYFKDGDMIKIIVTINEDQLTYDLTDDGYTFAKYFEYNDAMTLETKDKSLLNGAYNMVEEDGMFKVYDVYEEDLITVALAYAIELLKFTS